MRVLPHSLKRLLRTYSGEFGAVVIGMGLGIGMGVGFVVTKLDTGNDGSTVCFNSGCSEAPVIWLGDWGCWIAIDLGMA